eukprot:g33323.t1
MVNAAAAHAATQHAGMARTCPSQGSLQALHFHRLVHGSPLCPPSFPWQRNREPRRWPKLEYGSYRPYRRVPGVGAQGLPGVPPGVPSNLLSGAGGFSPGGLLNLAQAAQVGQNPGFAPFQAPTPAIQAQMAHERLLKDASERLGPSSERLSQLQSPPLDPRGLSSLMAAPGFQSPGYADLDSMLAENLLKQRHHLEQLHLQKMQQQQLQLHHLMQQQQILQSQMQLPQMHQMQHMPQMMPTAPRRDGRPDRHEQREHRKDRDLEGEESGGAGLTHGQSMSNLFFRFEKSSPSKRQKEKQTTVMLRNLPVGYSRDMLVALMNRNGFESCFDFVYIPINFRTQAMFGYAFVNFVDELQALRAREVFEGFTNWGVQTDKVCEVSWSDMHQGLLAHVNRYRSSPVMHESVPDEYKPAVYSQGKRAAWAARACWRCQGKAFQQPRNGIWPRDIPCDPFFPKSISNAWVLV